MFPKNTNRTPEVVRLPRRKQIDVQYVLVTAGVQFGPFRTEAQAVLFAAVRWPKDVPAWHIEKHGVER